MRATAAFQGRKASAANRLARDIQRALLASGFVIAVCVLGVLIATGVQTSINRAQQSRAAAEPDLSTGSMLVIPASGTQCRERTIDNSTWQIRDKGLVDCAEALAKSTNSGGEDRSGRSRIETIRDGFLGKQ